MKNIEKYSSVFKETFQIEDEKLKGLKYQDIPEWDSVGHMGLMGDLEDEFEIELDIDDIIDFSSFEKGQEILEKYNISFKE